MSKILFNYQSKIKGQHSGKSLLVWTTTPWTLPANFAVAIDANGTYAEIQDTISNEHFYILKPEYQLTGLKKTHINSFVNFKAKNLLIVLMNLFLILGLIKVVHTLLKFMQPTTSHMTQEQAQSITAPAFGEDDFNAAKQYTNLFLITSIRMVNLLKAIFLKL